MLQRTTTNKHAAAKKSASPDIAIEDDERHSSDVDSYIARNRAALNTSIKQSRAEIAKGKTSTKSIGEIVFEG
ncbi:MAG TPA: hypothetical protein VK779_04970 [Rhizomicrobium sp.]|nr:hypothetical protein [Rhizomicrobium sp.]